MPEPSPEKTPPLLAGIEWIMVGMIFGTLALSVF
jgi:hypothetical protein